MLINKILFRIIRDIKFYYRKLFHVNDMSLSGVRVNLKHYNISSELKNFFYKEEYEKEELGILKRKLKQHDRVMEIGAGIGFLSTYCAKKIGDENVFAFEANPFIIDKIRETYALNNVNPSITNSLLSDREGSIGFYLEKNFWSSSTHKRSDSSRYVEVQTEDINQKIKTIDPSLLIVDIEGGEKELIPLIDFSKTNIRKIVIEIHPHVIGLRAASEVICKIVSEGFSLDFGLSGSRVFFFIK